MQKNERHTGRVYGSWCDKNGFAVKNTYIYIYCICIFTASCYTFIHIHTGIGIGKFHHKAAAKKLLNLQAPTPSDVAANNMVQVVLLAIVENSDG